MTEALNIMKALQKQVSGPSYMLVTGMPNVGKSTILNSIKVNYLKGGKVAKEGPHAGVTRHVSSFKVSENPPAYILDSPGIMVPKIEKWENEKGLKLALTGAIKEHLVPDDIVASYLLFLLNQFKSTIYVKEYNLPGPTDNIDEVLKAINKKTGKQGKDATSYAARVLIKAYRAGELGKFTLDVIGPNGEPILTEPPPDTDISNTVVYSSANP